MLEKQGDFMELLIKENRKDNYGKVVNTNPLFAKILIVSGKAEKKPVGAKIKDLYWCSIEHVYNRETRLKKGENPKKIFKAYTEDYCIMQKENCSGDIIYSSPLNLRIKYLYEKLSKNSIGYADYISEESSLKKALKQNSLWCKDWDDETFFTEGQIKSLEKSLCDLYAKKINLYKEISF